MSRSLKEVSARSYITTAPFHLNFFKYKTSLNSTSFQTTGDLSAVPGATSVNCPAGRVLRENGKKLFPGAHPINTVNGVTVTFPPTVMVGVFDNQSGLNGYIDTNAPMFAVYNTDRPNYLKDSVDPVGGITDQSFPTLTNGAVVARGQVRSSTVTVLTSVVATPLVLDLSLGQVFTLTTTMPTTIVPTNITPGAQVFLILRGGGAHTITFGTNMWGMGVLNINGNEYFVFHFVADGTNLYEVTRTGALTDKV